MTHEHDEESGGLTNKQRYSLWVIGIASALLVGGWITSAQWLPVVQGAIAGAGA